MDPVERITGTRDEHYNLGSVLYRALHVPETMETYVLDADVVVSGSLGKNVGGKLRQLGGLLATEGHALSGLGQ